MSTASTPSYHPSLPISSSSPLPLPTNPSPHLALACMCVSPGMSFPVLFHGYHLHRCFWTKQNGRQDLPGSVSNFLIHNPFDPGTILICVTRTLSSLQTTQWGSQTKQSHVRILFQTLKCKTGLFLNMDSLIFLIWMFYELSRSPQNYFRAWGYDIENHALLTGAIKHTVHTNQWRHSPQFRSVILSKGLKY